MSGPRIVLFGVTGQVGTRLLHTLANAGYDVTGIDRARCDFETATVKDIATIIRAVDPVLIINAAAYNAVDQAQLEPERAHRINAVLPDFIAATAHEQHVPLLHFSTDYVFDGLRGAPYKPDATTSPHNAYAQSKRAGELAVTAQGGTILRLQWVFDHRGKNFFTTMRHLMAAHPQLRVVADQLGAPSHALHIAEATTLAVPLLVGGQLPGIYHLTAGGSTSWHGFACAIAQGLNRNVEITPIITAEYPVLAARPKDARLDCSALAAHGIAMPHWRDGLALAAKESA